MGRGGRQSELLPAPVVREVRSSCSVEALLASHVPAHTLLISNMFLLTKRSQKQTYTALSRHISIEAKGRTERSM